MENPISDSLLNKIVWIPPYLRKLSTGTQHITRHALKIWDSLHKREGWGFNSPLIPIKDSDYFAPGKEEWFGKWILEENAQLKDVMNQDKICTFQELKERESLLVIDPWRYNQLCHFIVSPSQPIRSVDNLRPQEKICTDKKRRGGFQRPIKF